VTVRILVRVLLLALVGGTLWVARTRPLPVAGSVLLAWAVLAGVALPLALPTGNLLAGRPLAIALEALATAGWLFLLVLRCRRTIGPPPALEIALIVLLAASEIARAWSVQRPEMGTLPALALQTAAAGVAAALAGRTLYRRVLSTQPSVRAHDSRSALAAVAAATDVLATLATTGRSQNRADTVARDVDRLHGLVRAEMGRIERVLLGDRADCVDFDVAQALGPVLAGHTLAGGRGVLSTDLGDAYGNPWTTAAVVDAALANVRAHAPGAMVSIGLQRRGAHVRIVIDDDGPGIRPRDRARVLGYGVRGSIHGPGTGIGLYSAAQAMEEQGGRLELADSPSGGLRVALTLPRPVAAVYATRCAS
jgi:signal transduction histidine kinase